MVEKYIMRRKQVTKDMVLSDKHELLRSDADFYRVAHSFNEPAVTHYHEIVSAVKRALGIYN